MNSQITKVLRITEPLLFFLSAILIPLSLYMIFMIVPSERVMGAVQRLFYYHVASAISCYVAFSVVFLASIGYLVSLNRLWAVINGAAGEVGFIFCTTTLVTGMIWGKAAWNTWFRWEPRLVTFLLLWLIFLSFIIIRNFGDKQRIETQSAIIGLLGSLTVPLVWLSVKLLPQVAQLHPQVIEARGLKHHLFGAGLGLATVTLITLALLFLLVRIRIGLLEISVFSKND
jgi:heme exporter protein C